MTEREKQNDMPDRANFDTWFTRALNDSTVSDEAKAIMRSVREQLNALQEQGIDPTVLTQEEIDEYMAQRFGTEAWQAWEKRKRALHEKYMPPQTHTGKLV